MVENTSPLDTELAKTEIAELPIPIEDRYRLLVNTVEDYGIFMLDLNGLITSWNVGAQKITGYEVDDIMGKHFSTFYTSTDIDRRWPEQELAAARLKGRFEEEGWRVRKDGSLFWASVIITAMYDDNKVLRGFAKVTRDMSARTRLEELESARDRMNEFLAMLAHELRNPLAPIRNAVSILHIEQSLSNTTRNCRDIIDRQLTHMTRLVDDLLDIGRITTGKITLHKKAFDIREAIHRSVEGSKHDFTRKDQTLDVDVPNRELMVNGDMTRLIQIVQNLLNNASKFTERNGHAAITAYDDGRNIIIKIVDNGRGMTHDALDEVFNLFVQEDASLNPSESGLGIGLTLCRSLVEMHGGAVEAHSPGKGMGSTFTVRLPLLITKNVGPFLDARGMPSETQVFRVLVVDDNVDSADSMAMFVNMMGHDTRAAYSGKEAIEIAKKFVPDVVLLDLAMPGLDGFQVREYLKEMPELEHTVISAMTGFGGDDARLRSISTGFDEHLVKPVSPGALKRVLDIAEQNE